VIAIPKPGVKPGERITQAKRLTYMGSVTALPDTDTTVAHELGTVPEFVYLTPLTTGVVGYGILTAKTATSIVVRGSASGVDLEYKLEG